MIAILPPTSPTTLMGGFSFAIITGTQKGEKINADQNRSTNNNIFAQVKTVNHKDKSQKKDWLGQVNWIKGGKKI